MTIALDPTSFDLAVLGITTTPTTTTPRAITTRTTATSPRTTIRKGWHSDPHGEHDLRFHDGESWTAHVTHFGPVPCQGCNQTTA